MHDLAVRLFLGFARTAHNLYCALLKSSKAGGGESGGGRGKGGAGFHRVKHPKKARFTVGIDHEHAYIKATEKGMYGPSSFVLTGE